MAAGADREIGAKLGAPNADWLKNLVKGTESPQLLSVGDRDLLAAPGNTLGLELGKSAREAFGRNSPYAAVFAALGALAGTRLHSTADLVEFDDDESPEAIDRAWAEAAVTFGPENAPQSSAGCAVNEEILPSTASCTANGRRNLLGLPQR